MQRKRFAVTSVASLVLFLSPLLTAKAPVWIAVMAPIFTYLAVIMFLFFTMGSNFLYLKFNSDFFRGISLGALFLLMLYEPFLILHSQINADLGTGFAILIIQFLLFGMIIQSLLFNLNMKPLVRSGRLRSFLPYALLLIFIDFKINVFLSLMSGNLQVIISFVFSGMDDVILTVLLAVLYLKSRLNNITGIVFYLFYMLSGVITVATRVDSFLIIFWNFIVLGVIFFVAEIVMRDNSYSRKIFSDRHVGIPSKRGRSRAESATIIGVVLFAVMILVVFPAVTGTAHPFYADPTGSMYPVIKPDSLLIIHGISPSQIRVGDIIVFTAPWDRSINVAHEVIGITAANGTTFFITKGIANAVKDPEPVPAYDVHGMVILAIPYLGYLLLYLYVILPLMLLPVIVKIK